MVRRTYNDSEVDKEIGRITREFAGLLTVDVCEEEVEFMSAIMRLLGLVIANGSGDRFAPKCLEFIREEQHRLKAAPNRDGRFLSLCGDKHYDQPTPKR
jgi:hypothetical protein